MVRWEWTPADTQLVQHIKTTVQYLPKLYNPEIKDFLIVETDASDDTWAGCLKAIQNGKELLKLDIDGNQILQSQPSELALLSNEQNSVLKTEKYDAKLCKCISGTFSQAEKNYNTHEKETLACLRTLKKWKIDLLETRFELRTDSKYVTEPIETSTQTPRQPKPITSTSKTQQSSSPSLGEKEFMKREEDIEKILQNSSHGKEKCNNPKELQEFPPKVQNAIKVYNDLFAKGRELYLEMHSCFPVFNRERKLVVPSFTIAQLGVSNQDYPLKDVNMKPTTQTLDDLALSLFRVYTGSSKIGSGLGRQTKSELITIRRIC
uniref:Reverse transcriptase n=1 Tax=Tanacetum cinerariifolium TaxID=118510 RepID=A0A699IBT9_TANCI|nr:reverse transcriptase [Tanacetum cinerariifolium]